MKTQWRRPLRVAAIGLTVAALVAAIIFVSSRAAAQHPAAQAAHGVSNDDALQAEIQYFRQHPDQAIATRQQIAHMPTGRLPRIGGHVPAVLPSGSFTPLGPGPISALGGAASYSGLVTALAVDLTTSGTTTTIYLGSYDGGVWKSTDDGQTWQALTDQQPDLFISAIAIDPTNHNVVYAGNSDGVLKTIDGGAHWTELGGINEAYPTKILVNPRNPQQIFDLSYPNLMVSSNGGTSWTQAAGLPSGALVDDLAIDPSPSPVVLFATVEQHGLYRSTNGGTSWSLLTSGLPSAKDWNFAGVAVAPSHHNIIYTVDTNLNGMVYQPGVFDGGFYSTDTGAHWTHMTSLNIDFSNYTGVVPIPLIAVDPRNDETLYGESNDLVVTTNARGTSGNWQNITNINGFDNSHIAPAQDALAFPACAAAPCPVYVGDSGGIFSSSNTTAVPGTNVTYTSLNSASLQITSFRDGAIGPNFAATRLALGQVLTTTSPQGLVRYTGEQAWPLVVSNPFTIANPAIDQNYPQAMYATQSGTFIRSTDGGTTWAPAMGHGSATLPSGAGRFVIDPTQDHHLAIGDNGNVWETTTGTALWYRSSQNLPSSIQTVGIVPNHPSIIYAVLGDGSVWRTASGDSGKASTYVHVGNIPYPAGNWTIRHFYPMTVDPNDSTGNTLYVSTFNCNSTTCQPGFVQSTNGGGHWTTIGGGLPREAFVHNSIVYYSGTTRVILVGTYFGAFYSINDGATWIALKEGLPNVSLGTIALDHAHTTLIAFTLGRGAWAINMA